jgi:hypothetical protein
MIEAGELRPNGGPEFLVEKKGRIILRESLSAVKF